MPAQSTRGHLCALVAGLGSPVAYHNQEAALGQDLDNQVFAKVKDPLFTAATPSLRCLTSARPRRPVHTKATRAYEGEFAPEAGNQRQRPGSAPASGS